MDQILSDTNFVNQKYFDIQKNKEKLKGQI
jgi:hypothetical protein